MSAQHPTQFRTPRRIGVVTESAPGETRVAATPATVRLLLGLGYEAVVESRAGAAAGFDDASYAQAGASIGDAWSADVVLKVNAPSAEEIALLRNGATLASLIAPAQRPDLLRQLAARGLTVLALDAVPRISRAQSMDVLSSMANIAGYRAVIEAAHAFGRFFTGQVTAAGKVPPAKVLVAGAGVAGLAAIGTASSLGAVVRATDPRPEVAEQVASLGGEYLAVGTAPEASTDGYARPTPADYDRAAAQLYHEQARDVDIIITTALIPGRPAPRLVTAADVAAMKPGSVVVDLAAAQGGNVEGTIAGRTVVTDNGVTVIGHTDLASRLPDQASQMFGTNVANLLALITPGKDGLPVLDFDDAIQRAVTVVRSGRITWPPPPVPVSAAPAAGPEKTPGAPADTERPRPTTPWRYGLIGLGMLAAFLIVAFAPAQLAENFSVFALAVVIGYYVIGRVHHALHTPLMSVTNAISGIVVIGALVQIGHGNRLVTVLSFVAILLTSVNIFGGFSVTRRMLSMFSKG